MTAITNKPPRELLGIGLYTVPEAALMTGVSAARIRRWLRGYDYVSGAAVRHSDPVWRPDLPSLDGALALSFRDLIEVRFVDYFLSAGVTWKTLREAAPDAAEIVGSSHPFSTHSFRTDGKRIFAEMRARSAAGRQFLDVVRKQYGIPEVIAPRLYRGLEFSGERVVRWFPLSGSKKVVIDPRVGFGQPTVDPEGVPTSVLAGAVRAKGSIESVAAWYAVGKKAVRDAVEFEKTLHAA